AIKKSLFFMVVICLFLPGVFTPIIGLNNKDSDLTINTVYEKVYKGFLYKEETLEPLGGFDSYIIEMKTGKAYDFNIKIDTTFGVGILITIVGNPGHAVVGTWGPTDDESLRKIQFMYTPATTGNHTLIIAKILLIDMNENAYTVYVNRNGFAGIWWMIAGGLGALLILTIIPVSIIKSVRKKKKKTKKRKK
ncbi:MAG: hypothetical protein ACTSQB_03395, partial [Candidatus Heimdallarchaeota archaeon]